MLDALLPPAFALLVSAALPFATARFLAWVYLDGLPEQGDERARRLAPFRRAALVLGIAQLELAWLLGSQALGPSIVEHESSVAGLLFGALCALVAFCAGGIARRVEEPETARSAALGVVLLRMRLVPFFAAPVLVAALASQLPVVSAGHVAWGWAALAFACVTAGVALGPVLLGLMTFALRPASAPVRTAAREVARREGASLLLVLRLPTWRARLANAAALPWARTMIVTDRAAELLDGDALRAVLAHEAGHLTEGPRVMAARIGAASVLLFAVTLGPTIAFTLPGVAGWAVLAAAVLLGLLAIVGVRSLARRMEERADARAAETVGGSHLARALRTLSADAQRPMVTGRRRVHPDLYDRLLALGDDPGPRPPPPPRGGIVLAVACALPLLAVPLVVRAMTDVSTAEIRDASRESARTRLLVDPWDPDAMLAAAWHARSDGDLSLARARAEMAGRMGADPQQYYVFWAELHAAEGDCDLARASFERSLEAQAARRFEEGLAEAPLELGGYDLPPTLVRACDLTVGDAFGGDASVRVQVE